MGTCFFIGGVCDTYEIQEVTADCRKLGQYDLFHAFLDVAQSVYIPGTPKYLILLN